MRNQLIISLLMIISLSSFAPRKRMAADAKGYLYYYCIKEEYNAIDSNVNNPYNKDYTGSYFVQMTNLSIQVMDSLHSYYDRSIKAYRGIPKESSYDATANMACLSCRELCEAKETRKYIKRIIK
ncbi:MAG: hypothetical protein BGO09_10960 [Bacteroidetes bacterium 47-18]|nr:MAG: hypothetical protein BGO09_10960 [Bacteroidetes bacterium 47-18]